MATPERDLDQPVVVVNRVSAAQPMEEVRRLLEQHDEQLRRLPDFEHRLRVRVGDSRAVAYWQFEFWRRLGGLVAAAHDDSYLRHLSELGTQVVVEADRTVRVHQARGRSPLDGGPPFAVVSEYLVGADTTHFEALEAQLTECCRLADGFGGRELLRSLIRPDRYLSLAWWRTTTAWESARRRPEYQRAFAQIAYVAGITVAQSLDATPGTAWPQGP